MYKSLSCVLKKYLRNMKTNCNGQVCIIVVVAD